ncbi:hypothetical protein GC163_06000 [bacterium]|nr:hypothetical protein [bacterium]
MSKPNPAAPEAPAAPALTQRIFRPRVLIAAAAIALLPVLGPWIIDQLPKLHERAEYQLPFRQIQLEPPVPAALPADFLEQVRHRGQLPEELSLLDDTLPSRLATAFAAHPWVAEVVSVRNVYPALVTVELKYRRPVALVQVPDGFYAIDEQSVLLPPNDFDEEDLQRYIVVTGIATRPRGAAGRAWGDNGVVAAAQLAYFIGLRWKPLGLASITLPQHASPETPIDDQLLELTTTGASRILWGRVPGTRHPGELTAEQKLGRLEKYLAEFGGFDRPQGPYEIDIRHWQEISRKPLSSDEAFRHTATNRTTSPQ